MRTNNLQSLTLNFKNENFLIFNLADYSNFTSHNDWILLSEQRPNDKYLALVVIAIRLSSSLSHIPGKTEKHRIIPRSVGGLDTAWNKVLLTNEMHQDLHRTRYAVYGNSNDGLAIRFRDGDPTRYAERARLSHCSQIKNGVGLGDRRLQSEKGKIGGKIQTEAKVKKYLEKQNDSIVQFHLCGSRWINKLVNPPLEVVYQPREIQLTADLKKKMEEAILSFQTVVPPHSILCSFQKTNRANFTSSIAKVIKTFMGETICSPRKKAWGWEIIELLNGELLESSSLIVKL